MRVLPAEIVASFDDFTTVFGPQAAASAFQSTEVAVTTQRAWLRLVGRRHDLQRWEAISYSTHKPPLSFPLPSAALGGWANAVLEPVRAAHFPKLALFAPAALLGAADTRRAILLAGRDTIKPEGEDKGRPAASLVTLKEVLLLRSPPTVLVFNVVEHGRRWYRSLVFTSRLASSLASLGPAEVAWHGGAAALVAGDALAPTPPAPSLLITRTLSTGETETFLPSRSWLKSAVCPA